MTATSLLWQCLTSARRERRLLRPASARRRLWAELRSPGHARQARRQSWSMTVDCGIASVAEADADPRAGARSDHHGSSSAWPDDCRTPRPSSIRNCPDSLSVPRIERRGRGVQAGLARGEASQRRPESERRGCGRSCCRRWAWRRWAPWPTSCRWSTRTACWCSMAWWHARAARCWDWPP